MQPARPSEPFTDAELTELARAITHLWHGIMRGWEPSERLKGLPAPLFMLLAALRRRPHSMSELAETLGTSAANVTAMIDKLVDRDLVERRRQDEDRRIVEAHITDAGIEELSGAKSAFAVRLDTLLEPLDGSERRQLLELLRRIAPVHPDCPRED